MQQANDRIGIIRVGIVLSPQHRLGGGFLQQMADGRFVRLVASHRRLRDRLGLDLIERRFAG
jgi:hypothetical protein